jgi:hypothetical protein
MLLEEESLCLRGIYLTLGVRGSVSVLNCAVWDLLCLGDGSSTYRLEMLIEWHYPPRPPNSPLWYLGLLERAWPDATGAG